MSQPTPSPSHTDNDLYLRARQVAAELTDEQVTAALTQGQQVRVTVTLHGSRDQRPGTVHLRGAVTAVSVTPPPYRQIFGVELTAKTRVYDSRLRELMLTLAHRHSSSEDASERALLHAVITDLETIQKLDREAAPDEWRECGPVGPVTSA